MERYIDISTLYIVSYRIGYFDIEVFDISLHIQVSR